MQSVVPRTACHYLHDVSYEELEQGPTSALRLEGLARFVREGAVGSKSRLVCGRSPMLARCWFTVARATLVVVSTNCCVMRR